MKRRIRTAVDLGNSMVKGAVYTKQGIKVAKIPNKCQSQKSISPKARELTLNGVTNYFGIGSLNNNVLKHTRPYLLEQVLVMLDELMPDEGDLVVDLATGLPPQQLFNESYLEEFKKIFYMKEPIEFTIRGKLKKVLINNVDVYAEGYSAFVSFVEEIDTKQDILVIDVGGETSDLCSYYYDYEDKMYYPNITDTLDCGIIKFSEAIATKFNEKHSADIKAEQIDAILKNNLKYIEYKDKSYPMDDYIDAIKAPVEVMLNKITNKFGKIDRYAVIGVGGGFKTFNIFASDRIKSKIEVSEQSQFYGNAIGYLEQD